MMPENTPSLPGTSMERHLLPQAFLRKVSFDKPQFAALDIFKGSYFIKANKRYNCVIVLSQSVIIMY